jgi:hypothetical protein
LDATRCACNKLLKNNIVTAKDHNLSLPPCVMRRQGPCKCKKKRMVWGENKMRKTRRRRCLLYPGICITLFWSYHRGKAPHSPAFLSLSGTAFDTAGDAAVDGGEVGSSSPIVASSLVISLVIILQKRRRCRTYPNVFERDVFSRVGGVPVREEAPESSPGRPREPPGPIRLPLLLREENIEVGPRVTFWLEVRLADPFSLLRSSRPTWLLFCCW